MSFKPLQTNLHLQILHPYSIEDVVSLPPSSIKGQSTSCALVVPTPPRNLIPSLLPSLYCIFPCSSSPGHLSQDINTLDSAIFKKIKSSLDRTLPVLVWLLCFPSTTNFFKEQSPQSHSHSPLIHSLQSSQSDISKLPIQSHHSQHSRGKKLKSLTRLVLTGPRSGVPADPALQTSLIFHSLTHLPQRCRLLSISGSLLPSARTFPLSTPLTSTWPIPSQGPL